MSCITYQDKKVPFDFYKPPYCDVCPKAVEDFQKAVQEADTESPISVQIDICKKFLTDIFGDDVINDVLGDDPALLDLFEFIEKLYAEIDSQRKRMEIVHNKVHRRAGTKPNKRVGAK